MGRPLTDPGPAAHGEVRPMVKRVLGVLAAVVLLVLLSPSAAMACGISYEAGGNADCGGSAPLIGVAAVYGAVGVTAVTLSVLSFLRGRMSPEDLASVLSNPTNLER